LPHDLKISKVKLLAGSVFFYDEVPITVPTGVQKFRSSEVQKARGKRQ
jgi:hypothetical protein